MVSDNEHSSPKNSFKLTAQDNQITIKSLESFIDPMQHFMIADFSNYKVKYMYL